MKYAAVVLIIITVLCLGAVGYTFLSTGVEVLSIDVEAVQPIENSAAMGVFDTAKKDMENGSYVGTINSTAPIGDAQRYIFFTYTLELKNNCPINMDMIEVKVLPSSGDVLQLPDEKAKHLSSFSKGRTTATILAPIGSSATRTIEITYYIWGRQYKVTTSY
ncbi:MAG: hypothetical protein PHI27_09315 [Eubacteriales bacterium]|nr:hypothetical protein [Eubacteriales bacterium]MDD3882439.1 hypothetical protein [Eubacteriales bacterium]MDD4513161.1 hypothetical protein [Eubacteriales bacterium]